ncbi:MAG: 16S rRNA (adenine(1518)-N(6)/adenine(1519)-N(6))-dimethyltransferase RsmA [Vicinamibacteraceae bacterium]
MSRPGTRDAREAREARHAIPNAPHAEARPKHYARKRFGQHFLEPAWAAKLVAGLEVAPGDVFIEIGPGRGALTRPLAATGAAIRAIEVDRDLAAALAEWAPPTLTLITGDFMALDDAGILPAGGGSVRIVGNLPYNLSTPILFRVLALARATGRVCDAVVMLQREVADRVLAAPDCGDYGPLAIMLGLFADRSRLLSLPPGAFRPPPKVHSAVIRLAFRPPPVPVASFEAVDRLVRTAFQQRRKTLANALRPLIADRGHAPAAAGPGVSGDASTAVSPALDLAAVLTGAGIEPTRRPETLTPEEFVRLADVLIPLSVL